MRLPNTLQALLFGLAVLANVSCSKKDDPGPSDPQTGQIEKPCLMASDSIAGGSNTNKFLYDPEDKVIRIERYDANLGKSFETLEYDYLARAVRKNKFAANGNLESYATYQYNPANQISHISYFNKDLQTGEFFESMQDRLTYNAQGDLIQRAWYGNSQEVDPFTVFQITHYANTVNQDAASYIEVKAFSKSNGAGNLQFAGASEYRFDDKKSAQSEINSMSGMPVYTGHNLISYKTFNAAGKLVYEDNYTYQYNAAGYPVKMTRVPSIGASVDSYFSYNCQ